jgi:hypothetical protein
MARPEHRESPAPRSVVSTELLLTGAASDDRLADLDQTLTKTVAER